MTIEEVTGQEALSSEDFRARLERLRSEFTKGEVFRVPVRGLTREQLAESKRRRYRGGFHNHRFDGERYLNCPVKEIRREYLATLVDEGGHDVVGGSVPSHNELDRWEAHELGLTSEEIEQLYKQDTEPESMVLSGWWIWMHRTSPWPVATGAGLVGEGEKNVPGVQEKLLREIDEVKEDYAALGIENVERAVALRVEHAAADMKHGSFSGRIVRDFVTTPEVQDAFRRAFLLNLYGRGSRRTW